MVSIATIMWLLPVVFMVHDLEEIIMMRPWYLKNERLIKARFHRLASNISRTSNLSTSAIALAAGEEFVVLSAIMLVSVEYELYSLWAGFLIGFLLHLIFHVGSFLVMGRYVPYIITSVIASIYSAYSLLVLYDGGYLVPRDVILWTLFSIAFIVVNLNLAVSFAEQFDKWLSKWSVPE